MISFPSNLSDDNTPEGEMQRIGLLVTQLTLVRHVLPACYTPSGADRNNLNSAHSGPEIYLPCDASANVSMCCALGGSDAASNDRCYSQGTVRDQIHHGHPNFPYSSSCRIFIWEGTDCSSQVCATIHDQIRITANPAQTELGKVQVVPNYSRIFRRTLQSLPAAIGAGVAAEIVLLSHAALLGKVFLSLLMEPRQM